LRYARLWAVLSGALPEPRYTRLDDADRRAIIEILRDTKPDRPPTSATDGPVLEEPL